MPDRLDLDIDGERAEAVPPPRKPAVTVPDDERPVDPAAEDAMDEAEALPFDEQEVLLEEDVPIDPEVPRDDWPD
ncbi:MAG: hypothetical protein ACRD29_22200 [Acidimicrobiales bacterium]